MEIHYLVKSQFDKNENFCDLPRSVKLAYFEIENHERKKKEAKLKKIEEENKQIVYTWFDKKNEMKNDMIKLGGSTKNFIGFFSYSQLISKWEIEKNNSYHLFNNFNDEYTFKYIFNHVKEYLCKNSVNEYALLELFKKYIVEDEEKNILSYIFRRNEIILNEDFRKISNRDGKYIIKIKDEYYVLYENSLKNFDNYNLKVNKLIPKIHENGLYVIYNYIIHEKEPITFNITDEKRKKNEDKILHIKLFDNVFIDFL